MSETHNHVSAATGEAAIAQAAKESALSNRVYRSEGDLWVDSPMNLSKFVRVLARQPHVVPDAAQPAPEPVKDDLPLTEVVARLRAIVADHGGLMHEIEPVDAILCPDCGANLAAEHHKSGWCPSVGVLPRSSAGSWGTAEFQAEISRLKELGVAKDDEIHRLRSALPQAVRECPNCHNANKYGDYEGPTCEVCRGLGTVPQTASTLNVKSICGSTKDRRVLEVWLAEPATRADRDALTAALSRPQSRSGE